MQKGIDTVGVYAMIAAMKRFAAAILLLAACSGCIDQPKAEKALKANNLKSVEITGYRFFGCGQDDQFHTGFTALTQDNTPVSGVVCSGWLKGATVRFD